MANPLTGDFEAVLQISGATVNRLLASMHQNQGLKNGLPTFPHSVGLRIGDPTPIDGMRGSAWAQVSVPRIELIHGSEDRFRIEVSIRARYLPDPGTTPLPEFIHGVVRADYQLENIDPNCWGWHTKASEYIWVRVIGSTVSFTGTAVNDTIAGGLIEVIDEAAIDARITRLIRRLLQTDFSATPHRVSRRFRRGSMRSLNLGFQKSLVSIPLSLSGGQPSGKIDSIHQDLLEGTDFAVGISAQAIVARVQNALDQFKASFGFQFSFKHRTYIDLGPLGDVDVVTIDIKWGIKVTSATAQWVAGLLPFFGSSTGGLAVLISGQARTQKAVFNWDFDAMVFLELVFDATNERFGLALNGSPIVNITGPFGGIVSAVAKPRIVSEITTAVKNALGLIGDQLSLKSGKAELVDQLATLDPQPSAHFEQLVHSPDGVIVRGRVYLSPRRPPVHAFVKTGDERGFTAFQSWIPGGRIDALDWSWSWFNHAGPPGSVTRTDRYLLRRPRGTKSKFGAVMGLSEPLPGLDGMGRVCLNVKGVHVHPGTGEFVVVSTGQRCTRFGFDMQLHVSAGGKLLLRELAPGPRDPIGPVADSAVIQVGGADSRAQAVNTLVIFVGDEWSEEQQAVLRDGLVTSQRTDAGLLVLVLFHDGVLVRRGAELMPALARYATELEAPMVANEDVQGTWSKALSVEIERHGIEWRLVGSTGGVTWSHSGPLSSRALGSALDHHLFPSADPVMHHQTSGLAAGARIAASDIGLIADLFDYLDRCPPPPVGYRGLDSTVIFAMKDSLSHRTIEKLAAQAANSDNALVTVIVDGADLREIEAIKSALPRDIVVLPDPQGSITRRFGIRGWPTTVAINEHGIVTAVDVGVHEEPPAAGEAS